MASPTLDVKRFRDVLGHFATGVAVVTARGTDGTPIGVTMSSFNSVSLQPPLVLFSVDRRARSLAAMSQARGYGINILTREQETLSGRFATAHADKWDAVEHASGYAQAPLLAGALAHFECRPYAQYDGGDHVIFVVEVLNVATPAADGEPLVFFRGHYRSLAPGTSGIAPDQWPLPIHY
jgi:flavin reductase (DIM6/NTAB) family NADH-FMN oxidoreductase RutF